MNSLDLRIAAIAARQDDVFTRADVAAAGGTDEAVTVRLRAGRWRQVHPGVYVLGAAPLTYLRSIRAATLAAGPDASASHRCGLLVWGLDGLATAPVEIVAPFDDGPTPRGVIVHRSRRIEPVSVVNGVAVTGVERSLLEAGSVCPTVVIEKAFSSAWRQNLTSPEKCGRYLDEHGGKGRRGTRRLREVVALSAQAHRVRRTPSARRRPSPCRGHAAGG